LAITELTFGKEYLEAIEGKQVAQQEAERAKYEVDQAKEHKKSIIIKAEAEARSI
jgi:prohibitin 2